MSSHCPEEELELLETRPCELMAGARFEKPHREHVTVDPWPPTTAQIPLLLLSPCPLPYGGGNVPHLPVCSNSIQND